MDFGRLGLVPELDTGRNRVAWALVVVLVCSRHQYVHVTYSQRLSDVIEGLEGPSRVRISSGMKTCPREESFVVAGPAMVTSLLVACWQDARPRARDQHGFRGARDGCSSTV